MKSNEYVASTKFREILFGDTPYGYTADEKSIKRIKIKHIKEFYNNYYIPSLSTITIVGDISKENIISKLSFLKNWNRKNKINLTNDFEYPEDGPTQIYLIDKPGVTQSVIYMGHKSNKFDIDGEYFKSRVMNYPFGGGASTRLFLNLREDKGYTYGVYSYFSGNKNNGLFTIFSSVKTEVTDSALVEILNEIENYVSDGITNEELRFTKNSLLNSDALKYESPMQKIGFLNNILNYDLDKNYITKQSNILKSINKKEIDKVALNNIKKDNI